MKFIVKVQKSEAWHILKLSYVSKRRGYAIFEDRQDAERVRDLASSIAGPLIRVRIFTMKT